VPRWLLDTTIESQLTEITQPFFGQTLRAKTVDKQEPNAAVLSCADSRVPVELIFDQSIGQVFVTRVAGNIATTATIASLEYGVAVLGTKAIIVLGHADCGAVKAAIEAKAEPGQISALYPLHSPSSQSRRSQSRGGRQGQCQHPGRAAPAILTRARRTNQAEPAQNRRRVLRSCKRKGVVAQLNGHTLTGHIPGTLRPGPSIFLRLAGGGAMAHRHFPFIFAAFAALTGLIGGCA
jgi:carbonic anhydrase